MLENVFNYELFSELEKYMLFKKKKLFFWKKIMFWFNGIISVKHEHWGMVMKSSNSYHPVDMNGHITLKNSQLRYLWYNITRDT